MASKEQLRQAIAEYEQLKGKLSTIANGLSKSGASVNMVRSNLEKHYTIDNSSNAACERTRKLSEEISETSNYVKNSIMPAITQKQEELQAEIRRIEEEEARRAREAEARRRAASRASSGPTPKVRRRR